MTKAIAKFQKIEVFEGDEKGPYLASIIKACGSSGCCPEVFIDHNAEPDRNIVIKDDFCKEIRLSASQVISLAKQILVNKQLKNM